MRVFLWHVHGGHEYLIPVLPDRGPEGRGRARTYRWPRAAVEVTPERAAGAEVDVVVLQRPEELGGLAERWLGGRRPGRDLPAVYLEHNAPQGRVADMRHVAADRPDLALVHVINEPSRRGRVTGTDLLDRLAMAAPVDLFGIGSEQVGDGDRVRAHGDLPHDERLLDELARRRLYLHPVRWTSLGLSLLEAMHLGMPVVGLATTEAVEAVPPEAGLLSTRVDTLAEAARELLEDPERARVMGKAARAVALERYGLARFLRDWDRLLGEVAA